MHRPERRMTDEDTRALLKAETYGVLSVTGEGGEPYGVPLNYVYSQDEEALFFHCAPVGQKMDCILREPRVCFTVVGRADIDHKRLTTLYSSVIAQGRASVITSENEKRLRLRQLCDALTPGEERVDKVIEAYLPKVAMIRVDITQISGKANRGDGE